MKKSLLFISLTICAMMLPGAAFADRWGHRHGHHGHGWGHNRHHHHGHHVDYYPAPVMHYHYPQPVVSYYAPPPPAVVYHAPPPPVHYYSGGRPSTNGLAGGVIGSVLGYQFGSGDPLAAGIGAAAGSYLGNGMGGY